MQATVPQQVLEISDQLSLPLNAVTETIAIIGKRGKGKTSTAVVLAEEMITAQQQVIVLDPTGAWWGLRSSSDGKGAGLPVVIFGGDHADVPLPAEAGVVIADAMIDQRITAILDLSLLSRPQLKKFSADFLSRLYARNRNPAHIIVDEADMLAPQASKDSASLLVAMQDLVRRGRLRGLGVTLICQRPAALNKDVLSQAEVLICLGLVGVRDIAAINAWVTLHDDDRGTEVRKTLASLPTGTAWIWSPSWLGILQKVRIRPRRTFDSSATPVVTTGRYSTRGTAVMATVDLKNLITLINTVSPAKDETATPAPTTEIIALRMELTTLRRQLAEAQSPQPADQARAKLAEALADARRLSAAASSLYGDLEGIVRLLAAAPERTGKSIETSVLPEEVSSRLVSENRAEPAGEGPVLRAGALRILKTLAQHHPSPLTVVQLATLSHFKARSGTYKSYLSALKTAGYLMKDNIDHYTITHEGFVRVGGQQDRPKTTAEVQEVWNSSLRAGARAMLDKLIRIYPAAISKDDLAEAVGMSTTSGTFKSYLSMLKSNGLAKIEGHEVAAGGALFLHQDMR